MSNQLDDYDAGCFSDYGGGDVSWWKDYLRVEIERCNTYWRVQAENLIDPLQSTIMAQEDQITELKEIIESIFDFSPTHKQESEDSRQHFCVYCGEQAGKHLDMCPVKRFSVMNELGEKHG